MRYASFHDFWPYYLSEHQNPNTRKIHFVGTSGFLGFLAYSLYHSPIRGPIALIFMFGLLWFQFAAEHKRPGFGTLGVAILLMVMGGGASILAGVLFAYGFAWFGHFFVEHNKPATFTYPLWSLTGDFRMFATMLTGKLWSGDGTDVAGVALSPEDLAERARAAQP